MDLSVPRSTKYNYVNQIARRIVRCLLPSAILWIFDYFTKLLSTLFYLHLTIFATLLFVSYKTRVIVIASRLRPTNVASDTPFVSDISETFKFRICLPNYYSVYMCSITFQMFPLSGLFNRPNSPSRNIL